MKSMNQKAQAGFTLIELMIVVAIIGILAAVAIPAYQNYVKRAAYTDVVSQMSPYKLAVEEAFQNGVALADMDAATNGGAASNLPTTPTTTATGSVFNSLAVADGQITATPNAVKGIASTDTCVLSPSVAGGADASSGTARLTWAYSGACLTKGYVKN
ncbi:prepilin-type N-terminal cleavage/methylation domain-containing protein [Pseudoduganella sp. SL102]|uniref:pilin n=1 Tax=Pseudoduganella sp. SL102 TaxID=2995154 RepID=UPI00248B2625|nr:prepilin-type N-terminal cleavage/methylation domain-containing protein [Pseudoduganella sp. SL102]WBS02461.1 prepilin-type N-terminal cleavage/methylation domain-containing protein [Pseudoduganella sp. SL102]